MSNVDWGKIQKPGRDDEELNKGDAGLDPE